MAIVKCRPTSPGRRHMVKVVDRRLHKGPPLKSLTASKAKTGGRGGDSGGSITTRHIGGGHKRSYRLVDFRRRKENIEAKVERIEYDPNRSCHLALVCYQDGTRSYILAPRNLSPGDRLISGAESPIKVGNALPLSAIPVGATLHNVELKPGRGGQLARAAGTQIQLVSKLEDYATLRLPSGEVRKVLLSCRATIGAVGNAEHMLRVLGKAGASRWRGIRPTVRGTAMNPVDHPHGGGEGKTFGKHPVSPQGQPTKGKKTRNNKRTDKYIVQHRRRR